MASLLGALAAGAHGTTATPAREPIRDIGVQSGLRVEQRSYAVRARDVDGDGRRDLLFVHHTGPTELFRSTSSGFELQATFVDETHGENDRHDCAWGDVDLDGRLDLYCVKGARVGTAEKHNELWMQQPDGTFVDRAGAFRVVDRWGRGRRTEFLDLNGDAFPDLFVGNAFPRRDGRPTPNRTFLNVQGERFRRADMGLTREAGASCVDVGDFDGDGSDDLLICEKRGLRLYLRRQGGFDDATGAFGIPERAVAWARSHDLDRDGALDLVTITERRLTVRLRVRAGRFDRPSLRLPLEMGHAVEIADIDGRAGADLLVVQGCVDGVNVDDLVLLNDGTARIWQQHSTPGDVPGCGDVAATLDFDRDGAIEFVVMNGGGQGQPLSPVGPDQLLTMGDWPQGP